AGAAARSMAAAASSFRRMVWFVGTRARVLELRCQPWTRHARQPRLKRDTSTVRRKTLTIGRGVAIATRAASDRAARPQGAVVAGFASMASTLPLTPAR